MASYNTRNDILGTRHPGDISSCASDHPSASSCSALFLRSNKRLYDWLLNHPRLGPYITNFMVHRSIPLKIKVISVSMVWVTLLNCAIFVAEHWLFRLFFILLATAITIHILSYRTQK